MWLGVAFLLGASHSLSVSAAAPEEIDSAISRAKTYLYSQQNAAGNWELVPLPNQHGDNADVKARQWGGLTAIATYALLAAGEDPRKSLARPIQFLESAPIVGIYALGLRSQVWPLAGADPALQPFIERDRDLLLSAIHSEGGKEADEAYGFYSYYVENGPRPAAWYDRSVSQYGVFGVWAAQHAGAAAPLAYWRQVDDAWRAAQNPDGGWDYQKSRFGPASTVTMTAAGVATLLLTQQQLSPASAECRGNVSAPSIDRGIAWLERNIRLALSGNYYGMFGIERIGLASGRKRFAGVDWRQAGADYIVHHQAPDGSFSGVGGPVANTAFCLLFLTRGRAPIVMSKLRYHIIDAHGHLAIGPWNQRGRDAANFSRWMSRNLERELNWQWVSLDGSENDDLYDAPILYLTGDGALDLRESDEKALRAFCEQGGLILGSADGGADAFSASFQDLGQRLFPRYRFRDVPADHVIYANEQFKPNAAKWTNRPRLLGLSNGVRELMLLIPQADLSRSLEMDFDPARPELHQLAADIALYARDKKIADRSAANIIRADPAIRPLRRVTLARLQAGANPDPEPGGWRRLAAVLHNEDRIALNVRTMPIDAGELQHAALAHLTGTGAFTLTKTQRQALADYVASGGTLLIDAAGGDSAFADAAEAELREIFSAAPHRLAASADLYTLAPHPIAAVGYRTYARRMLDAALHEPRVQAIEINARQAVFYSREDLSAGLVGQDVDGIIGYDPPSALAIVRNIILMAARDPAGAAASTSRPAPGDGEKTLATQPTPP